MIMFPEFTILAATDLVTSKSEKPAGEITNDFEVKIPFLTSMPSFLRMYVFEALNASKRGRLNNQINDRISPVHAIIGMVSRALKVANMIREVMARPTVRIEGPKVVSTQIG